MVSQRRVEFVSAFFLPVLLLSGGVVVVVVVRAIIIVILGSFSCFCNTLVHIPGAHIVYATEILDMVIVVWRVLPAME